MNHNWKSVKMLANCAIVPSYKWMTPLIGEYEGFAALYN
jgi:hypothetical protein